MAIKVSNKDPLDLNKRVAIGVSIPFSSPSVFNQTFNTIDQIKSNLINYLLTNYGERILNPTFGSNIRAQLFENITDDKLRSLEIKLINDIKKYFPLIKLETLDLIPKIDQNEINLNLKYTVFDNDQTIQIIL